MKERDILLKFINKKQLRGRWFFEVPINKLNHKDKHTHGIGFRIDAVCKTDNGDLYLIEVKKELNRELLGQILTDSFLVKDKHKRAVVVQKTDLQMEEIFRHYNIEVFKAP